MNQPEISIVVPVFNSEATIAQCIESLLALDYPKDKYEIVVVDNASTDGTAKILDNYPVRVLPENRRGACCARNTGWRAAAYDLIAFTDSDCRVEKNWLSSIAPHFQDPMVGASGGPLDSAKPQTVIEEYVIRKDILSQKRAMRNEPISPPFLITANAVYRREALEKVDGFDDAFTLAGEDADLCWRIVWLGYSIKYEPEATVIHQHRSTLRGMLKQVRNYGAGSARLFKKHRKKFGYNSFFISQPYKELFFSFFKMPFSLIFKKNRLERVMPILDFLGAFCFLWGKVTTSIRLGVRFF